MPHNNLKYERVFFPGVDPRSVLTGYIFCELIEIEQGYIEDTKRVILFRELRNGSFRFWRTVQSLDPSDLHKEEHSCECDGSQSLFNSVYGRMDPRFKKLLHCIRWCGMNLEVVEFQSKKQNLTGYFQIRIKFKTQWEADAFSPPSEFGRDVTHCKQHEEHTLGLRGIPTK